MATQTKTKPKKTEAPPKVLNVAFVWDMSGSMGSIEDATREGTQGYLMDLQKEERKLIKEHGGEFYTRLSVTAFDTAFEEWVTAQPILDINVKKLVSRYGPRGGTALYDAIANTVSRLDSSLAGDPDEKFLVIVMTDGAENSSQEYGLHNDGKRKLFKMIKRYEKKGNWTFVYLGANVDAYSEGAMIGFAAGNTVAYSATPSGTKGTSSVVTNVTNTLRNNIAMASVSSFDDAGEDQDLREEDDPTRKLWTPKGK